MQTSLVIWMRERGGNFKICAVVRSRNLDEKNSKVIAVWSRSLDENGGVPLIWKGLI